MFLSSVVSTAGMNFLCTLVCSKYDSTKVFPIQLPVRFSDDTAVASALNNLQQRGVDIYMAMGTFSKNDEGTYDRKAEHCLKLKSLWLDIDAGSKKYAKHGDVVYPNQDAAMDALMDYLGDSLMPIPTYIVSSGEGLHVYWAFDHSIEPAQWLRMAKGLVDNTKRHGLKVDHSRTTDMASIMRLPGTTHSASGNTVTILHEGDEHKVETLEAKLTTGADIVPDIFDMLGTLPSFAGDDSISGIELRIDSPKSFNKIIMLEREESAGCAQLYWMYKNQNNVPEPLWRAGLSVAQYCEDRDTWIHELSNKYHNYSPDEVEAKASACKGPYTCAVFESLRPEGCANCPHKARDIKSPIVLGLNPHNIPVKVLVQNKTTKIAEEFVVPTYPAPYYRKPQGGIYVKTKQVRTTPEGFKYETEVESCVWERDFYITERVAEVSTQRYWCRHHSAHDGVVEFELNSDDVAAGGDSLHKVLFGMGIPVQQAMRQHMSRYIQAQVKQRVEASKAKEAVRSMGWTASDTFILGDKEYTPTGVRNAPVNSTKLAHHFTSAMHMQYPSDCADDPLRGWRELLSDAYPNDTPAAMAGQYIVCAAIGAPITSRFALDDQRSGLINIYSTDTGYGKTTATALATRVYGDPKAFTIKGASHGSTMNAFFEMLGYSQAVPLVRDEITLLSADEISDIVYSLVNGKTKIRMEGKNNDIREGEKTWGTYVFATSNQSIVDSLVTKRGDPTAQYARVTEIEYPAATWLSGADGQVRSARVARRMEQFSGVAGAALSNWLVKNYETAKQMYIDTYAMLATMIKAPRNVARFWLNHATGVVVGALVGEELGLHPFKTEDIMAYAVQCLDGMWKRSVSTAITTEDAFSDMLLRSIDEWLVISKDGAPLSTVHRNVRVRVEYDSNTMWVNAKAVHDYASENGRNAASLIRHIEELGGVKKRKRLLAGTVFASGSTPAWAWEINLSSPAVKAILGE